MEKTFYFDDQKIYYRERGTGYPIIIIHGWGSQHLEDYSEFQDLLASRGFRVIFPNFPGFGKSSLSEHAWVIDDYIKCILALANKLKLEKLSLLGHSWGTTIAVKFAAKHPERLYNLILCGPEVLSIGWRTKVRRLSKFKRLFDNSFSLVTRIVAFLPFKNVYSFLKRTTGVMRENLRLMIKENVAQYLEEINVPTLIIWGDKDRAILEKSVRFINQKMGHSELKVVKGGPHAIREDFAETVVDLIIGFINKEKKVSF